MLFNKKGFTLIELMVAIAIVAILATIGFSLLQNTQALGRDAKRRQDIDAIANALESAFNPATGVYTAITSTAFVSGLPSDPINTGIYVYTATPTGASPGIPASGATYVICAQLEKAGGNSKSNTTMDSASGSLAIYYCKANQQ